MARLHESVGGGSVTPSRRARSELDEEEEEDTSVDGETPRANGRKRMRLSGSGDDEDGSEAESTGSETPERPLLPDTYRRSPRGSSESRPHQPGSIVRVKMIDFVTYTNAEFHLGPNLNMIIGPNGTGKSTLVCAICLGLGWGTINLGRAKELGEYVKHGCRTGTIEIELAADPTRHRRNPVIKTRITKENSKAEYSIDGKKSNKKQVIDFAKSFHIQVDNLCQFLPQDRVVEFAAMNPVAMLAQTQRAAAPPEMSEMHEQLKDMRKVQREKEAKKEETAAALQHLENRQRLQQGDYQALQDRKELQHRISTLEKFRPFPLYKVATANWKEAKAKRKTAEKDFSRLERQMEPNLLAVRQKEAYLQAVDKAAEQRIRLLQRSNAAADDLKKKFDAKDRELEGIAADLEANDNSVKKTKQSMPQHRQTINGLRSAMENPPEAVDMAALNEAMREKSRQIHEIDDKARELEDQIDTTNSQGRQRKQIYDQARNEKENLQSQVGQQTNKLRSNSRNGDAARAWDWIKANKDQFKSEVFGPAVLECSLRNSRHAAAVESLIPQSELFAFTVTSRDDFKMLGNQLYGRMGLADINIRESPAGKKLADFHRPCSDEQLRSFGLESWIVDLLDGPEEVLTMLCDNRMIHQNAFTTKEPSEAQYNALTRSTISSFATPTTSYQITRRREYGENAMSTRVLPLKAARFFTDDVPVDRQTEDILDARMREAQADLAEMKSVIEDLQAQHKELRRQKKELENEKKAISEEKNIKQSALTQFQALPAKLDAAQRKLDAAQQTIRQHKQAQQDLVVKGDKIALEKGQLALDFANSLDAHRKLQAEVLQAEMVRIEAKSDLDQLEARHKDEQDQLNACRAMVEELIQVANAALEEGRRLQAICVTISERKTAAETAVLEEIGEWMPDDLETEIESVQARLAINAGGNMNVIREFEDRIVAIERARGKLTELESALETLAESIESIKQVWEPQLDDLVAKISAAFSDNFAQIHCAGEVGVYKDEDFEQWAIQIKVKFRESEPLSVLDSHRQSGGERAVSTIFYLLSLQTLAQAPFRVVDEINQGMDPRNERLVHSRMVSIACATQGSQYFLITPKLLPGLEYHRNMKVHCIASGEYMPESGQGGGLDFKALAVKALALRRAVG